MLTTLVLASVGILIESERTHEDIETVERAKSEWNTKLREAMEQMGDPSQQLGAVRREARERPGEEPAPMDEGGEALGPGAYVGVEAADADGPAREGALMEPGPTAARFFAEQRAAYETSASEISSGVALDPREEAEPWS